MISIDEQVRVQVQDIADAYAEIRELLISAFGSSGINRNAISLSFSS
jgi:hypothetical protein